MLPRLSVTALIAVVVLALASCSTHTESPPNAASASGTSPTPTSVSARSGSATGPSTVTPVVGYVLAEPIPVPASDGKVHLAYELLLTNMWRSDVTLTSVTVTGGDKTLATLTGDAIARWTRIAGLADRPTAKIGSGQTAFAWLDVAVDGPSDIPGDLSHTLGLAVQEPQVPLVAATLTQSIAPTKVDKRTPLTISPPLKGPNWWVAGSCCAVMSGHRTAVQPLNGELWVPERFAIDFQQLTPDMRLYQGDKTKPESFPFYGTDVLAVADGPVVAVQDNLPEEVPFAAPEDLDVDEYGGNYIVQDIGGGNYAFYAHLKGGGLKVKPGDRLTAGQSIAALGNSGHSRLPHLHFHIMSTPDPLRSNGLPFKFTSFRLDAQISPDASEQQLDDGPVPLQPGFAASDQADVMPLSEQIVSFATG